jgi:hypothetical protein
VVGGRVDIIHANGVDLSGQRGSQVVQFSYTQLLHYDSVTQAHGPIAENVFVCSRVKSSFAAGLVAIPSAESALHTKHPLYSDDLQPIVRNRIDKRETVDVCIVNGQDRAQEGGCGEGMSLFKSMASFGKGRSGYQLHGEYPDKRWPQGLFVTGASNEGLLDGIGRVVLENERDRYNQAINDGERMCRRRRRRTGTKPDQSPRRIMTRRERCRGWGETTR